MTSAEGIVIRESNDPWVLEYESYVPGDEPRREALCTLGNGRFATRGAAPELTATEGLHYPGTYAAGVYNRLVDKKAGREISNESLVNLPNWIRLTFRIDDGAWFSIDATEILEFRQALEIDRGILIRQVRFSDEAGRETTLTQRRLVSMARRGLAAMETNLRSENWNGRLTIRSSIDGSVENRNVKRYRELSGKHLEVISRGRENGNLALRARTTQSRIESVIAVRHRLWRDGDAVTEPTLKPFSNQELVGEDLTLEAAEGTEIRIEKTMALFTSNDTAISEPMEACRIALAQAPDFAGLEEEHVNVWWGLWRRFEIHLHEGTRVRQITNLHIFHLLQVASPHVVDLDVGIPARGLHGEAYRGHVFWDELFVFPALHTRAPEIAKSLLRYRHRRLPAARRLAGEAGYRGAMFPWQSGSDGTEETPEVHLNPKSGRWFPDLSHRQRHINIAIAYNVIQYARFTGDRDFLAEYGGELLIEIARFWASIASYDRLSDRHDIVGVMGPDEFHDDDPNWDQPGLRNNSYTNVMVSWLLHCVPSVLQSIPARQYETLEERLGIVQTELEHWEELSRKLKVPLHEDGIISQFQGYEALEEFDWEGYRDRYGNIERLDRILEAEGDSANRYKASKQADVLMLFYLLSFEELVDVFGRLGIIFTEEMLAKNVDYYMKRTSHGSTLSRLVHSWVLARYDRPRSMALFRQALESDVSDIQDGTTQEGIHLGAMAGTVDLLQRGYSGMRADAAGVLRFEPSLPPEITHLDFSVYYRQRWLDLSLRGDDLSITSEMTASPPVEVAFHGERVTVASGETVTFQRVDNGAVID